MHNFGFFYLFFVAYVHVLIFPGFLMGVYYEGITCVFGAQTYAIFTSKISIYAQNQEEKKTNKRPNEWTKNDNKKNYNMCYII